MGRAVGIDLGTTYTAVAAVDEYGKPVVLKNVDGQTITPSAVFFDAPHYVVGETAVQATLSDPSHVAQFAKRFMGTPGYRMPIGDRAYSPEFVSALILKKVVQDATIELGEPVDRAVITVPAYFTESQRQATLEAGQMAGLQVLRIINEPTAAALSYGMMTRRRAQSPSAPMRRILVYDLGGGTFDVTILEVDADELNVVSIGGDARLGGKDFDDRIMTYVEEQIKLQGFDLGNDATLEAEVRLKSTAAKRHLTGRESVPITLKIPDDEGRNTPVRIELTRALFEEITKDLMNRTEMLLNSVLANANLTWNDITEVLCVGGSSRMPMVGAMLRRISGKEPLLHDPDECVAKGAALQAALIESAARGSESGNALHMPPVTIGHVLSHSLGVAVLVNGQPQIDHVIPALTRLPTMQVRHGYTTTRDEQEFVQIRIYEGESRDPQSYGKGPIGIFSLPTNDPPRLRGTPNISVAFRCDENGQIMAAARDRDTGKETRLTIALKNRRSLAETSEEAQLLQIASVT